MSILIGVKLFLYDEDTSSEVIVRLSYGNIIGTDEGERRQWEDRIYLPIQIGMKINAEQYGQVIRNEEDVGNIVFALDEEIWNYLDYHWVGRKVEIYRGDLGDEFQDFNLIYVGLVSDLTFEATTNKATIKFTDNSLKFDKPIISELYDDTSLENLRGKPKPKLWGEGYSLAPALIDDVNQIWQLDMENVSIYSVEVGGVSWDEKTGSGDPGAGQWKNLGDGTFKLGSVTLNGEVRCHAKKSDITLAGFIQEIIEREGEEIDATSFSDFESLVSGNIGVYTGIEPVNILDIFDTVVQGAGGWSGFNLLGKYLIGVIAAPETTSDFDFDDVSISGLERTQTILPGYRIRIEYKRNWQPVSTFFEGVTDAEQKEKSSGGIIAEAFNSDAVKVLEPKAIDVPLIRSLFINESDAIEERDRLSAAWGVRRYLYNLVIRGELIDLYNTIGVDYSMVNGNFRVHSMQIEVDDDNDKMTLQVWG